MPIIALTTLSNSTPEGKNKGSITEAINRIVIRGVPRQNSMYVTDSALIIAISERLPKASKIPKGNAKTIPTKANANVRRKPPHWVVFETGMPKKPPYTKTIKMNG
jgi:hypothetical protein